MTLSTEQKNPLARRFRGLLPVVIDVETAGFNASTDALLEIAAVSIRLDHAGFVPHRIYQEHILPFEGANLDPKALEFNKIDPYHPLRFALEEKIALTSLFSSIEQEVQEQRCQRAVLVGHNASFDLEFLKAAWKRTEIKNFPFHRFTVFDTASLSLLVFGQSVLARACQKARIAFDPKEAHSALYDASKTAELFCAICNRWKDLSAPPK